jgi:hypothetical protein
MKEHHNFIFGHHHYNILLKQRHKQFNHEGIIISRPTRRR